MHNNRGFTLIEVMASTLLLAILATFFFQMFIFSQTTTTTSKEKLVAINVAQGVIERIKNDTYPELTTAGTYTSSICSSSSNPTECQKRYKIKINNIDYTIEILVSGIVENGMNLHSVKVIVYDEDGKTQSSVKGFVEL